LWGEFAGADFGAILSAQKPKLINLFKRPVRIAGDLSEGVDQSQNLNAKQLAYICTQGGRHPCP